MTKRPPREKAGGQTLKPILPCLRLYRPNSNGNEAQGKHGRGKDSRNGGAVRERAASFCGLPSPIGNLYIANLRPVFWGKTTLCLCRGQNASQDARRDFERGYVEQYRRGGSAYRVRIVFASFAVGMFCRVPSGGRGAVWGYPDAGNLH